MAAKRPSHLPDLVGQKLQIGTARGLGASGLIRGTRCMARSHQRPSKFSQRWTVHSSFLFCWHWGGSIGTSSVGWRSYVAYHLGQWWSMSEVGEVSFPAISAARRHSQRRRKSSHPFGKSTWSTPDIYGFVSFSSTLSWLQPNQREQRWAFRNRGLKVHCICQACAWHWSRTGTQASQTLSRERGHATEIGGRVHLANTSFQRCSPRCWRLRHGVEASTMVVSNKLVRTHQGSHQWLRFEVGKISRFSTALLWGTKRWHQQLPALGILFQPAGPGWSGTYAMPHHSGTRWKRKTSPEESKRQVVRRSKKSLAPLWAAIRPLALWGTSTDVQFQWSAFYTSHMGERANASPTGRLHQYGGHFWPWASQNARQLMAFGGCQVLAPFHFAVACWFFDCGSSQDECNQVHAGPHQLQQTDVGSRSLGTQPFRHGTNYIHGGALESGSDLCSSSAHRSWTGTRSTQHRGDHLFSVWRHPQTSTGGHLWNPLPSGRVRGGNMAMVASNPSPRQGSLWPQGGQQHHTSSLDVASFEGVQFPRNHRLDPWSQLWLWHRGTSKSRSGLGTSTGRSLFQSTGHGSFHSFQSPTYTGKAWSPQSGHALESYVGWAPCRQRKWQIDRSLQGSERLAGAYCDSQWSSIAWHSSWTCMRSGLFFCPANGQNTSMRRLSAFRTQLHNSCIRYTTPSHYVTLCTTGTLLDIQNRTMHHLGSRLRRSISSSSCEGYSVQFCTSQHSDGPDPLEAQCLVFRGNCLCVGL